MKERYNRLVADAEISLVDSAKKLRSGIASDEERGRDDNILRTAGLQWKAWLAYGGPMPFCHDDTEPPVAGAVRAAISGTTWRIWFRFVSRDINPFAGVIEDLVDIGVIGALSTSWKPLQSKPLRGGGFEFTSADVIEVSIVQCPALASALIDARSRGVNTAPLYQWAERRLDMPNYKNEFLERTELEAIRRAARMPARASNNDWLSSTRAQREARVRELLDNGREQRLERARELIAGGALDAAGLSRKPGDDMTESESDNVKAAADHLQRALRHHRSLANHHDQIGEEAGKLRDCQRAITSTLSELGIDDKQVTRSLKELDRCARAIRTSHTGAEDSADSAGGHIDKAADCISAMKVSK